MKERLIKIYGERNTGTNYLSQLVEKNVSARVLPGVVPKYFRKLQRILPGEEAVRDVYFSLTFARNLGWKHALVRLADDDFGSSVRSNNIVFLTLTKNPYSWVLSLFRRPYHSLGRKKNTVTFEEFLSSPWPTVGRETGPREFLNPIDMWNRKNHAYRRLGMRFSVVNLRYEDLLADPEGVLSTVESAFSLQRRRQEFQNVERSTKDKKKDYEFYRAYYLEEMWREELSHEAIRIINDSLDDDVLCYYGYQKLL